MSKKEKKVLSDLFDIIFYGGSLKMISKNDDCIIPLMQYLKEHSPDSLVSINLFINSTGMEITTNHKSANDLKIDGISMRNIKGEWIKDEEIQLNENGEIIRE